MHTNSVFLLRRKSWTWSLFIFYYKVRHTFRDKFLFSFMFSFMKISMINFPKELCLEIFNSNMEYICNKGNVLSTLKSIHLPQYCSNIEYWPLYIYIWWNNIGKDRTFKCTLLVLFITNYCLFDNFAVNDKKNNKITLKSMQLYICCKHYCLYCTKEYFQIIYIWW
jgi:hypothetical protein